MTECYCLVVSNSFTTPWTVTHQAPLSMGFPRQEYWSGLPFLSPEDLPNSGIEPTSPAWQVGSLLLSHLGRPECCYYQSFLLWKRFIKEFRYFLLFDIVTWSWVKASVTTPSNLKEERNIQFSSDIWEKKMDFYRLNKEIGIVSIWNLPFFMLRSITTSCLMLVNPETTGLVQGATSNSLWLGGGENVWNCNILLWL